MKRSEIWLVKLDPTVGDEITKTRPAVIVNNDKTGILSLKIVVPISDWKEQHSIVPWLVRLEPTFENGLSKVSKADAFQVRSISQERFVKKIGALSERTMKEIAKALSIVLNLE
jgi:mRNA interferase MazF